MILTGNMFIDTLLHFIFLLIMLTFVRYAVSVSMTPFIFSCLIAAFLITVFSNIFYPSFTLNNLLKAIEMAKSGPKPECPTPPTPTPMPCPPSKPCNCSC